MSVTGLGLGSVLVELPDGPGGGSVLRVLLDCPLHVRMVPRPQPPQPSSKRRRRRCSSCLEPDWDPWVHAQPAFDVNFESSAFTSGPCDVSAIDVVLLTHPHSALALPYLLRSAGASSRGAGFNGHIYATEPTLRFAEMAMKELIGNTQRLLHMLSAVILPSTQPPVISSLAAFEDSESDSDNESEKQQEKVPPPTTHSSASATSNSRKRPLTLPSPPSSSAAYDSHSAAHHYTAQELSNALSRVHSVSLGQTTDLCIASGSTARGSGGWHLTAVSSGLSIGAANWILTRSIAAPVSTTPSSTPSPNATVANATTASAVTAISSSIKLQQQKVALVGASCAASKRYPLPLDLNALRGADVMVVTQLCPPPPLTLPPLPSPTSASPASASVISSPAPSVSTPSTSSVSSSSPSPTSSASLPAPTPQPAVRAASSDVMLVRACTEVERTLRSGGHVLIPIGAGGGGVGGLLFDLVEYLTAHLNKVYGVSMTSASSSSFSSHPNPHSNPNSVVTPTAAGRSAPSMYLLSGEAHHALHLANINAEYLQTARQSHVLQANTPFLHWELVRRHSLVVCRDVNDPCALPLLIRRPHSKQLQPSAASASASVSAAASGVAQSPPAIVFVAHSALCSADLLHLLLCWDEGTHAPPHTLLLCEPVYGHSEVGGITEPHHPPATATEQRWSGAPNGSLRVALQELRTAYAHASGGRALGVRTVECPIDVRLTVPEVTRSSLQFSFCSLLSFHFFCLCLLFRIFFCFSTFLFSNVCVVLQVTQLVKAVDPKCVVLPAQFTAPPTTPTAPSDASRFVTAKCPLIALHPLHTHALPTLSAAVPVTATATYRLSTTIQLQPLALPSTSSASASASASAATAKTLSAAYVRYATRNRLLHSFFVCV
jgi:hypothetical protein